MVVCGQHLCPTLHESCTGLTECTVWESGRGHTRVNALIWVCQPDSHSSMCMTALLAQSTAHVFAQMLRRLSMETQHNTKQNKATYIHTSQSENSHRYALQARMSKHFDSDTPKQHPQAHSSEQATQGPCYLRTWYPPALPHHVCSADMLSWQNTIEHISCLQQLWQPKCRAVW